MALKVGTMVRFPNGDAVPAVDLSGNRETIQATSASSAAATIPSGARMLAVRATQSVWIRWGTSSGMDAAAADDNAQLFPAGELAMPTPLVAGTLATHFKVLRAGDTDGWVQVEQISCVNA